MDLLRDEHSVLIGDARVTVTGTTGPISARWCLLVDDEEADRQEIFNGDHVLTGTLPDGSPVEAHVHQSIVGPTRVQVRHGGREVMASTGYVA
jgi:hypothetical protein